LFIQVFSSFLYLFIRRRLSLGIALIGDPRVLMLDEPTTGLDPEARRLIWEIISEERASGERCIVLTTRSPQSIYRYISRESCSQFDSLPLTYLTTSGERCIVLTTHLMEEADALSSRIAIMAGGKVKVVGTQQRIKDRFGEGLRISVAVECDAPGAGNAGAPAEAAAASATRDAALADSDAVARAVAEWLVTIVAQSLVLSRAGALEGVRLPTRPRVHRVHRIGGSFVFMVRRSPRSIYRYISRESCSQFDSLPLTYLTPQVPRSFPCERVEETVRVAETSAVGGGGGAHSAVGAPPVAITQVSALFEHLVAAQRGAELGVARELDTGRVLAHISLKDWAIRQASLEEVFVKVAEGAEGSECKGIDTS